MLLEHRTRPLVRTAAGGVLAFSALSLAACGDTAGPETGTDVEDVNEAAEEEEVAANEPYEGAYDTGFYDQIPDIEGQTATVSADVNEIIDPSAFTIAGTDDTSVDELLVVSATEVSGLQPDLTVAVTGTVHTDFDLPTVEEELGVDLDDALFEEYEQQAYISATSVDTSVTADQ